MTTHRNTHHRRTWLVLILALIVFAVTPIAASAQPYPEDSPEYAASRWIEALLTADGLALGRYTCRAFIDTLNSGSMAMTAVNVLLGSVIGIDVSVEVDLADATFTVSERSATEATVVMGGELIVAVAGAFQRIDGDVTFELSVENNRWRVCSFDSGAGAVGVGTGAGAFGTPLERVFDDGVAMVQVPAGCFMMGSGYDDEQPQHQQCFDAPFWIDRTEVTQGDFTRLGGVQAEQSYFAGADRPVETITWFEARDFCALRGARLPTEAEWEYAARGPDGLAYPWGNAWNEDNAVWDGNSGGQTAPVGSRPAGRSWVGADDMSGNVWEWTSSLYESYPYAAGDGREADTGTSTDVRRVVRGGSWGSYNFILRAANRNWVNPVNWYNGLGFRCARSS